MHLNNNNEVFKKNVFNLLSCAGVLEFQDLGSTSGVDRIMLQPVDDGHSAPIAIPGGFPFWSSAEDLVHVGATCNCDKL